MMKLLSSILLFCLLCTFSSVASSSLVVVVSKNSAIESLSSAQVANIFLARTKYFPNGEKSTPIEYSQGEFRDEFYQTIAGKNSKQLMSYWTTLVFTGKGRPPKVYSALKPLIENLSTQQNYITYLDSKLVTDNMKIVYRFP